MKLKLCMVLLCLTLLAAVIHIVFDYFRIVKVTHFKSIPIRKVKVILSWIPFFGDFFYGLPNGDTVFKDIGCEYNNCLITGNRSYLPEHEFNAILFHGYEFYEVYFGKPSYRSSDQYYVFMSLESAARGGIQFLMKDFYNLSMTYRLDSDIPWPYFLIRDLNGNVVGPKINMHWKDFKFDVEDDILKKVSKKKKKIAWFVSNCRSVNKRGEYVEELQKYIEVDVYGKCGPLDCKLNDNTCTSMLENDYFFYLAFENSHCKDYITEKVLTALNSFTIPIVYGSADLSRFLPPHSYVDANLYTPEELASLVNELIQNPYEYAMYFWWKNFYRYERSMPGDIFPMGLHPFCKLCEILNRRPRFDDRHVKDWWHGADENATCLRSDQIDFIKEQS